MILKGIIVEGESAASGKKMNWNGYGSIYHQINFLNKSFPEFTKNLYNCKMATINVLLNTQFKPKHYQYTFNKVYWLPNCNSWSEKLSFTEIIFKYKHITTKAWLYKAHSSPHKNDKYLVEIIAPEIKNLNYQNKCIIEIDEKYY